MRFSIWWPSAQFGSHPASSVLGSAVGCGVVGSRSPGFGAGQLCWALLACHSEHAPRSVSPPVWPEHGPRALQGSTPWGHGPSGEAA